MKPFYIFLLFFFSTSFLFAQTITTKWTNLAFDTTMKNAQLSGAIQVGNAQKVVPREIIYDKNSFIYLVNTSFWNWQIEKLNPSNGKTIWQNARNYKTPKLDSLQYVNPDLFLGENNTLEILGTELGVRYPYDAFFIAGSAAKVVYDMETGKELAYYNLPARIAPSAWMWNRSADNFLKKKGGYFTMEPTRYVGQYGMLRKISDDLKQVDTIRIYKEDSLSKKKSALRYHKPYYINNAIYYSVGMIEKENPWDSTRFFHRYYKLDTLGNILRQKDFNKEIFSFFGLMEHEACKNGGFLWAGYADPYKKFGKNDDYEYYVQKIDTNFNIQWRVFLPKKNTKFNYVFKMVELQDNQGYLIFNSAAKLLNETLLYHVTVNGKVKFLGKIELKDNPNTSIQPQGVVQLPNKDIVFSFGITDCADGGASTATHCGGTALISYSSIEKMVSATDLQTSEITSYTVFPNPVQERVSIKFLEAQEGKMTIFDIQGRELLQAEQKILSEIWEMNVSSLPTGVYFLQLQLKNGEIRTEKVIKE